MTTQAASDSIKLAALLLCGRLYFRQQSPLGVAGAFDLGQLYVRSHDPDIRRLLKGRRGIDMDAGQEWPDVDDVRTAYRIDTAISDAQIQLVIDAVTDHLTIEIQDSFGLA